MRRTRRNHAAGFEANVFGGAGHAKTQEPDLRVLSAKIGQLTLENDCLEGAQIKAGLLSERR